MSYLSTTNLSFHFRSKNYYEVFFFSFTENDILDEEFEVAVEDSAVPVVIRKCKRMAAFFHRSSKASSLLQTECKARNLKFYRIIQCVSTRWNSLYFMMIRIRDCIDCIHFVLVKLKKTEIEPLTSDKENILNDILLCLKPFAEATEELGGEKYLSMSLVIPNVGILLDQLGEVRQKLGTEAGSSLLNALINNAEKRLLKYEERSISG